MKKVIAVIFAVLILLSTSCRDRSPASSSDVILGSGNLVTEVRTVGIFHSLELNAVGNIDITFGPEQYVSVSADDNIMEYITTIVSGGTLTIGIEPGIHVTSLNLTVDLTMTDLEELSHSSAGTILGENTFNGDSVILNSSGAGDMRLDLEVAQLNSTFTGAGNIFLSGKADQHQISITGAGNLHAFDLITETTTVNLTGVGSVEVNVSQLLEVTIAGSGSVYYKGYPTIIQNITGTGSLIDSN